MQSFASHQSKIAILIWLAVIPMILGALAHYYYNKGDLYHPTKTSVIVKSRGVLPQHLSFALRTCADRHFEPHFGIYIMTCAVKNISPLSVKNAFTLLLTLHIIGAYFVLFHILRNISANNGIHCSISLLGVLTIGLLMVAPIGVPLIPSSAYGFGKRGIMLWRNATHTAAVPYIALAFGYFLALLQNIEKNRHVPERSLWIAGIVLFFSALMKPSFAASFVPTLWLWGIVHLNKKEKSSFHNVFPILIATLPTISILLAQYYLFFVDNPKARSGNIIFNPFVVWEKNNIYPLLSMILATVFPLYVTVCRKAQSIGLRIASINFLIAVVPYAILQEQSLWADRNFEWSYLHAIWVWFVAATLDLLKWIQETIIKDRGIEKLYLHAAYLGVVLLFLHIIFGYAKFLRVMYAYIL